MSPSRLVVVLAPALLVPILAECIHPSPTSAGPDDATRSDLPPLSYYRTCRAQEAHHGLGQDVPCNGTATRVRWSELPLPGWVPSPEIPDSFWTNASSVEEQWGFSYRLPSGVDRAGGVLLVETMDERRLYHWPVVAAGRGFVAFPPAPWGETIHVDVLIYHSWAEVNGSRARAD